MAEKTENTEVVETTNEVATETPSVDNSVDYEKEISRLRVENEKLRKAESNACADASSWKKKFRATLSEQEQMAAEQNEKYEALLAQNNEYKARERSLNYYSKLMESGYDSDTAKIMANTLPEGINDEFFAEQKRFCESIKTKAREEALNMQPGISSGKAPSAEQIQDRNLEAFRRAALGI